MLCLSVVSHVLSFFTLMTSPAERWNNWAHRHRRGRAAMERDGQPAAGDRAHQGPAGGSQPPRLPHHQQPASCQRRLLLRPQCWLGRPQRVRITLPCTASTCLAIVCCMPYLSRIRSTMCLLYCSEQSVSAVISGS